MVGKLLTTNSYNVRAFKTTMANVWKAKGELEIKDSDMEKLVRNDPWNFDQRILILKDLNPQESPKNIDLRWCHFWLQGEDIPPECRTN
ncbi:hypothetical protein AAZX31_18G140200 [Glycine max]